MEQVLTALYVKILPVAIGHNVMLMLFVVSGGFFRLVGL
jgi:hypothetical protein